MAFAPKLEVDPYGTLRSLVSCVHLRDGAKWLAVVH